MSTLTYFNYETVFFLIRKTLSFTVLSSLKITLCMKMFYQKLETQHGSDTKLLYSDNHTGTDI